MYSIDEVHFFRRDKYSYFYGVYFVVRAVHVFEFSLVIN